MSDARRKPVGERNGQTNELNQRRRHLRARHRVEAEPLILKL